MLGFCFLEIGTGSSWGSLLTVCNQINALVWPKHGNIYLIWICANTQSSFIFLCKIWFSRFEVFLRTWVSDAASSSAFFFFFLFFLDLAAPSDGSSLSSSSSETCNNKNSHTGRLKTQSSEFWLEQSQMQTATGREGLSPRTHGKCYKMFVFWHVFKSLRLLLVRKSWT